MKFSIASHALLNVLCIALATLDVRGGVKQAINLDFSPRSGSWEVSGRNAGYVRASVMPVMEAPPGAEAFPMQYMSLSFDLPPDSEAHYQYLVVKPELPINAGDRVTLRLWMRSPNSLSPTVALK
jgi:hypothetical protein